MRSYVIHRQSDNTSSRCCQCILFTLGNVYPQTFLLCCFFSIVYIDFAKGCLFSSLMKIEKTIYSLCLVTFSADELFGEK